MQQPVLALMPNHQDCRTRAERWSKVVDELDRPLPRLAQTLATRHRVIEVLMAKAQPNVGANRTGELAIVELKQPFIDPKFDVAPAENRFGRGSGSRQRTGERDIKVDRADLVAQHLGLCDPDGIQRDVLTALATTLRVPCRATMPYQHDSRPNGTESFHGRYYPLCGRIEGGRVRSGQSTARTRTRSDCVPRTTRRRVGRSEAVRHRRHQRSLREHDRLWQSPFGRERVPPGMPEPIELDGSAIVMSFVGGPPLAEVGQTALGQALLSEFAHLIADLHGSGVVVPRRRSAAKIVRSLSAAVPATELGPLYEQALMAAQQRVTDTEPLVLSHGDCSPRNVVISPDGLVVIDFDRLHLAERGRDPGYFGAWTWTREFLAGLEPSWAVADEFLTEYAAHARVDPEQLVATSAFHRGVGLLRIAKGWPSIVGLPENGRCVLGEALRILSRNHPRREYRRVMAASRTRPPFVADERTQLLGWLDLQRELVHWKCEGISDADAYRVALPTSPLMTVAGLVSHMRWTEHCWFEVLFLGGSSDTNPQFLDEPEDADMRVEGVPLTQLLTDYRAQCETSNRIIAAHSLDDVGVHPDFESAHATLRWMLLHMLEEVSRHVGHLDIIRELLDGSTGYY